MLSTGNGHLIFPISTLEESVPLSQTKHIHELTPLGALALKARYLGDNPIPMQQNLTEMVSQAAHPVSNHRSTVTYPLRASRFWKLPPLITLPS